MDEAQAVEAFGAVAIDARGQLSGSRPGRHHSRTMGAGGRFAGLGTLLEHPDPRQIDVRATVTDPFGTVWVRRHRLTATANVFVLADCSGSMAAQGRGDRRAILRILCGGLAHSVERSGDQLGLVLAGVGAEGLSLLPASRRRGLARAAMDRIEQVEFRGPAIPALRAATNLLPARRAIVLLISDFADAPAEIATVLDRLAHHDVRPIVLRDSSLEEPAPRFGLVELRDLESGRRRLVLMRKALRDRWQAASAAHRASLHALFLERGLAPIEIVDQIDLDDLLVRLAGPWTAG